MLFRSRLEDICAEISAALEKTYADPAELDALDRRIDLIGDLKHKYGGSIEAVRAYYDKGIKKLEDIINSEKRVIELKIMHDTAEQELARCSESLYEARKQIASVLETSAAKELNDLGMKGTLFRIDIDHACARSVFGNNGQDTVEFMISPNTGEELRSLSKIASGGESSRIMLAIKTILADIDRIPVLIFDEIDTGVSGRTANLLADKLRRIAENHQVLCVTHMAQIASKADDHIRIDKSIENGRTYTHIDHISGLERIDELARLLSGGTANAKAAALAREMLGESSEYK